MAGQAAQQLFTQPGVREITLPYNWDYRPYQQPLWKYLRRGGKRAVAVWHRRAGKDDVALHATACAAHERIGNYWHMLPEYEQGRKAIWNAVNPRTGKKRIDEAFPLEIRKSTNKQQMYIEFRNGSTWQVVGSDNYDSFVGSAPIGIVFSEYSLANPLSWAYVRPILLENDGWALFIYTPRGDNHGKTQFEFAKEEMENGEEWFAELLDVSKTNVFTKAKLDGELRERIAEFGPDEGQALFDQEYWCSFKGAMPGSYYAKVLAEARSEGRIRPIPYVVGHPVFTFWDLGFDDSMSIWFMQEIGKEIRFIDYYENSRFGLEHYAHVLLHERKYMYGDHYMPHDAANSSLQTGVTNMEYAEGLGIKPVIVVPRAKDSLSVIAGINQGRRLFNQCWFDEGRCANGLSALASYHSDHDYKKKKPGNYPVKDWACLTGETKLLTRSGMRQIMHLPKTGEVMTQCGWTEYINPRKTKINAQLVEVRFKDGYSVRCTPDHLFLTENGWKFAEHLLPNTLIQSYSTHSHSTSMAGFTGRGRESGILHAVGQNCTGMFGGPRLEQYLMAVISTIGMVNQRIINSLIWSVLTSMSISPVHGVKYMLPDLGISTRKLGMQLGIGINPKQVGFGTNAMRRAVRVGKSGSGSQKSAFILSALKSLWLSFVLEASTTKSTVPPLVNPLIVETTKPLNSTSDVWCITVPHIHHYALENGAIVHNSHGADAFRTFAVGWEPHIGRETVGELMVRMGMRVPV